MLYYVANGVKSSFVREQLAMYITANNIIENDFGIIIGIKNLILWLKKVSL